MTVLRARSGDVASPGQTSRQCQPSLVFSDGDSVELILDVLGDNR